MRKQALASSEDHANFRSWEILILVIVAIAIGVMVPLARVALRSVAEFVGLVVFLMWPEIALGVAFTGSIIWPLLVYFYQLKPPFSGTVVSGTILFMGIAYFGVLLHHFVFYSTRKRLKLDGLDFIPLVFVAFLLVSLIWSGAPNYGTSKIIGFVGLSVIPIFFVKWFYGDKAERLWRVIGITAIITLAGIVILLLISKEVGSFVPNTFWYQRRIIVNDVYGISIFGFVDLLSIGFVCAFALFIQNKNWILKTLWLTIVLGAFWGLLVLGERAQILGSLAGMACIIWFRFRNSPKWYVVWIPIVFVFLLMLTFSFRFSYSGLFNDPSTLGRLNHYSDAIKLIVESPILGTGTGGFAIKTLGVDERYFVHNVFLEVLVENGIIGLAVFLGWLFLFFRRIVKNINNLALINVAGFALFLNRLVIGMTSNDLQNLGWGLFMGIALAGLGAAGQESD
jgi:hypothetical protein